MAVSSNPILWDFHRTLSSGTGVGGLFEYSDTTSQSIFLTSLNAKTKTSTVTDGDWEHAILSSDLTLFDQAYLESSWEIPNIYMLVGAAIKSGHLFYLRTLGPYIDAN